MTSLPVFFESRSVGTIDVVEGGPGFTYDADWLSLPGAFPISTSMPLVAGRVPPEVFVPWAANLLPESEHLRSVSRFLGTSTGDIVGILSEIGRDTAGALSIGAKGTSSSARWVPVEGEAALARIVRELPNKPFLVGDDGVSMSLAGAQSKLAVALSDDGRIHVPTNGSPSTHILKPDSDKLWGGVQVEALCMVLARRIGMEAAEVVTGKAEDRSYLLVRRYDRVQAAGRWRRIHQEDFCQALGKPPSAKYEANHTGTKGPTVQDMFVRAREIMPGSELLKLLDMVVFNVLACNTDAHAKNYSMLVGARGARMTPIYDVMCASVWDGVTRNLAQKIAGKNRGDHLKGRHWQRMAVECGLSAQGVLKRVERLAALVERNVVAAAAEVRAMPAGDHSNLGAAADHILRRSRTVALNLAEVERTDEDDVVRDPAPAR